MTRPGTLLAIAPALFASAAIAAPAGASAKIPPTRAVSHKRGADGCTAGADRRRRECRGAVRGNRHTTPRRPRTAPSRPKKLSPALEASQREAVTIAKVLATPCQNTQLTPEPGNLPLVRGAVLCLINNERAQHGEEPLVPNAQLEQAAESHGREMIALDYFDHVSPSGQTPVDRIRSTGYIPDSEVGYVIGENLAWGTLTLATPQAIVAAWEASPEHLANILESQYLETGIDVRPEVPAELAEGSPGALYTQEFGVIVH